MRNNSLKLRFSNLGVCDFILNSSLARQLKETLDDAGLRPFKDSDAQNAVTMSHFIYNSENQRIADSCVLQVAGLLRWKRIWYHWSFVINHVTILRHKSHEQALVHRGLSEFC